MVFLVSWPVRNDTQVVANATRTVSTSAPLEMMFNHDAVKRGYAPKPASNEYFVLVQVETGDSYMVPRFARRDMDLGQILPAQNQIDPRKK